MKRKYKVITEPGLEIWSYKDKWFKKWYKAKFVYYYDNGEKSQEQHYNSKDEFHISGRNPANISWYENGQMYYAYYINGKLHNYDDMPAIMKWYENGQL